MADVGVEPGLALDALLQLVDHGVERVGEALEVGVGGVGVEPRVESPPAMAPAARETSASGRSDRTLAKRPERDARGGW